MTTAKAAVLAIITCLVARPAEAGEEGASRSRKRVAVITLRPVHSAKNRKTNFDRLEDAARISNQIQALLARFPEAYALVDEGSIRAALGFYYRMEIFDCADDRACVMKRLQKLRSIGADLVITGSFSPSPADQSTSFDLQIYDVHKLELRQRIELQAASGANAFIEAAGDSLLDALGGKGLIDVAIAPPPERILLDGEVTAFRVERRVELSARPGFHRLALERTGFETLTASITVRLGDATHLELAWKAVPTLTKGETPSEKTPTEKPPAEKPPKIEPPSTSTTPGARIPVRAVLARVRPKIDGVLDDAVWREAPHYTEFYNRFSVPRWQPVDEATEAAFAYDAKYFYVAFWFHARDGQTIADGLYQNYAFRADDACVLLDAEGSGEGAREFCVSAAGQRETDRIYERGEVYVTWTDVWDVRVSRSDKAWFAEMAIPWTSIGVYGRRQSVPMGLQAERTIIHLGQRGYLAKSTSSIPDFPPSFAIVKGVEHIEPNSGIEVIPGVALQYTKTQNAVPLWAGAQTGDNHYLLRGSVDARVPFGDNVILQATYNPDFTDTLLDPSVVNLTRFQYFLDERRTFFSEVNDLFLFGVPGVSQLFYSRSIGLTPVDPGRSAAFAEEVPLLGGLRLLARSSDLNVGALVFESGPTTQAVDDQKTAIPSANYAVARAQYKLFDTVRVGTIFTQRLRFEDNGTVYARAYGVDFRATAFDDKLTASSFFAASEIPGKLDISANGSLRFSHPLVQAQATYTYAGKDFFPAIGFYQYPAAQNFDGFFSYTPEIGEFIDRLAITIGADRVTGTDASPVTQAVFFQGTLYHTTGSFTVGVMNQQDSLADPFSPIPSVTFPTGSYDATSFYLRVKTPTEKFLSAALNYSDGGFLSGSSQRVDGELNLALLHHFSLNGTFTHARILGPDSTTGKSDVIGANLFFFPTPDWEFDLGARAANFPDTAVFQFIGRWQYLPGSFINLVLLQRSKEEQILTHDVEQRLALIKMTYVWSP